MFNRTVVQPPNVTVNVPAQKPIDPSDAARFYAECMERARKEVAEETLVRFGARNEIAAVRYTSVRNFETDKTHVQLLFKVNGEVYNIHVEDTPDAMSVAAYDIILHQVIAKLVPNPRGLPK